MWQIGPPICAQSYLTFFKCVVVGGDGGWLWGWGSLVVV
jgi:hypothetical protein